MRDESTEQYCLVAKPNVNVGDIALVPILRFQKEERLPDRFKNLPCIPAVNARGYNGDA